MSSRVWQVLPDSNRYLSVQQPDLRYFNDRFEARRMAPEWEPPPFEVLAKGKNVADFTSWQIGSRALLVSRRVKDAVAAGGANVEFLPFARIKRVELFALNVLETRDVVDWDNTADEFGPYALLPQPRPLPLLFKDSVQPNEIFASDELGTMAIEHGWTGLRLADPKRNLGRAIVRGERINEYPGL